MWDRIVRKIGGVHDLGRLTIVVHDYGVFLAWDSVIISEWRIRLPKSQRS